MVVTFTPVVAYGNTTTTTAPTKVQIAGQVLYDSNSQTTLPAYYTSQGAISTNSAIESVTSNWMAKYEAGTTSGSLTLNNLNITTSGALSSYDSLIYVRGSGGTINIILKDNNYLHDTSTENDEKRYGIYTDYCNANISGIGSLTVTSGAVKNGSEFGSYGIYSTKDLTVSDATINVTSGDSGGDGGTHGIHCEQLVMSSGKINATGGDSTSDSSYGIYATNISLSGGTIDATGGTTKSGNSAGINFDLGSIEMSNGTITAVGGNCTGSGSSYGISCSNSNINLSGGTINATGGIINGGGKSYGIHCQNLSVLNGIVEATGLNSGYGSYGISTNGDINITNGAITATGGAVDGSSSYGISTQNFNVYGGTVTASGGSVLSGSAGSSVYYSNGINASVLNVHGGEVIATGSSGKFSFGIKSSPEINVSGGTITAIGGTITATGDYSTGIGDDSCTMTVSGGSITAKGTYRGITSQLYFMNNMAAKAGDDEAAAALAAASISTNIDGKCVLIATSSGGIGGGSTPGGGSGGGSSGGGGSTPSGGDSGGTGVTPTPGGGSSGGSYRPSRPASPTINIGGTEDGGTDPSGGGSSGQNPPQGTATYNAATRAVTIAPAEGFIVKEVVVNGKSLGAVTSVPNVSSTDSITVIFVDKATADKNAKIKAGVKNTKLRIITAKALTGWNKITWTKATGFKVDYYEIWRKAGRGKYEPFYITKTHNLRYSNNKAVKAGLTYRYKLRGVRTVDGEKVYTEFSNVGKVVAKTKNK